MSVLISQQDVSRLFQTPRIPAKDNTLSPDSFKSIFQSSVTMYVFVTRVNADNVNKEVGRLFGKAAEVEARS